MKITFITTGGTIDKDYPHTTKGWAFEFGEPAIHRVLEKLNHSLDYEVISPMAKDSLEVTDTDRDVLIEIIRKSSDHCFVITHGTDTMIDTGRYIYDRIQHKSIVLTGAMRPERFYNSDALINVGAAMSAVQIMKKGVYLTMNGIAKSIIEVKRDLKTGRFH